MMNINPAQTRLYTFVFLLFSATSLLMVWSVRFPPMQDYPTHLKIAKILATADEEEYNWRQFYSVEHELGPYRLSYFVIAKLHHFFDIETAGKLFISVYFLLITLFAAWYSREHIQEGRVPWLLLLIFPLAFNQAYYFGFLNYLLSIPILLWLLCDYINLTEGKRNLRWAEPQLTFPFVLFLLHPYSLLVYIVLTASSTFTGYRDRGGVAGKHLIPFGWLLGFIIWYLLTGFGEARGLSLLNDFRYVSIFGNIHYLLLPFYGHQISIVDGLYSYLSWVVIVFILFLNKDSQPSLHLKYYLFFLFGGFFLLPFNLLGYPYFNLRITVPLYFVLVLYLAQRKLDKRHIAPLILATLFLYHDIYNTHVVASNETMKVASLLTRIPKNSNILPIYSATDSNAVDKSIYYQFHAHTHDYYHSLVGGGMSPDLFFNEMLPIRLHHINSQPLVTPGNYQVLGKNHTITSFYDYILLRSDTSPTSPNNWQYIEKSGEWYLYLITTYEE